MGYEVKSLLTLIEQADGMFPVAEDIFEGPKKLLLTARRYLLVIE